VTVDELKKSLEELGRGFVELGRLQGMQCFFEPRLDQRLSQSLSYWRSFEAACTIFEYAKRYFRFREPTICWSTKRLSCNSYTDGSFQLEQISSDINSVQAWLRWRRDLLMGGLDSPFDARLRYLLQSLVEDEPADAKADSLRWKPPAAIRRVLRAPSRTGLDPVFRKGEAPLVPGAVETKAGASNRISTLAPALWITAMQEGLASRLCLMTLFEYDGLPLSFYRDFAKQAADEADHAVRFLNGALALVDELPPDSVERIELVQHGYRSDRALTVPREGDFYEAIWAADLRTRIVWMHIDTEGPGVGGLSELCRSNLVRAHPELQRSLEFVVRDEVTHASLGRHWLRFLQDKPDFLEVDDARLMRGLMLSSSVAISRGQSLGEVDFVLEGMRQ
jgi:hypothetical protein